MDNLGAAKRNHSSSSVGCSPSVAANDQPASPPLGGRSQARWEVGEQAISGR